MGKGWLTTRNVLAIFGRAETGDETARMKRHERHPAFGGRQAGRLESSLG